MIYGENVMDVDFNGEEGVKRYLPEI